jgi:hypothetical protein
MIVGFLFGLCGFALSPFNNGVIPLHSKPGWRSMPDFPFMGPECQFKEFQ